MSLRQGLFKAFPDNVVEASHHKTIWKYLLLAEAQSLLADTYSQVFAGAEREMCTILLWSPK